MLVPLVPRARFGLAMSNYKRLVSVDTAGVDVSVAGDASAGWNRSGMRPRCSDWKFRLPECVG
jgi:hypothetical protein